MSAFNMDFDKKMQAVIRSELQHHQGCFACGKGKSTAEEFRRGETHPQYPASQCSKCKVARYCDVTCQKKDWKEKHKEECRMFYQNRDRGFCFVECLRGSGWIGSQDFDTLMLDRQELFVQALKECDGIRCALTVAVVPYGDTQIRLSVMVRICDGDFQNFDINHVVYQPVEEGIEAVANIQSGSGELSDSAMQNVVQKLQDFLDECKIAECPVLSMTLGRGLVHKGDELREQLENGARIIMMPSTDYVISSPIEAMMSAAFGSYEPR